MKLPFISLAILAGSLVLTNVSAQAQQSVSISNTLEQKVIEWRRDLHQHPELSNREFRSAKVIAAHLESLGWLYCPKQGDGRPISPVRS